MWQARCTYKSIDRRGGIKGWVLSIKVGIHTGHELAANPLAYHLHATQTTKYKEPTRIATNLRYETIPCSDSRRVHDRSELGLTITSKQFYNRGAGSIRRTGASRYDDTFIPGLLVAVDAARFRSAVCLSFGYAY